MTDPKEKKIIADFYKSSSSGKAADNIPFKIVESTPAIP